jgi:hypothetical protein
MDLSAASAGFEMWIGGLVHPCTLAPCASRMAPFNPSDGGTLFFLFETGMTLAGFVYFCVTSCSPFCEPFPFRHPAYVHVLSTNSRASCARAFGLFLHLLGATWREPGGKQSAAVPAAEANTERSESSLSRRPREGGDPATFAAALVGSAAVARIKFREPRIRR